MSYGAITDRFFRLSLSVSLSFDICWDTCLSPEECCHAACAEVQWHDQTNSVQLNTDKAKDETDGAWLYSAVMSLLNKEIILVMMFHY